MCLTLQSAQESIRWFCSAMCESHQTSIQRIPVFEFMAFFPPLKQQPLEFQKISAALSPPRPSLIFISFLFRKKKNLFSCCLYVLTLCIGQGCAAAAQSPALLIFHMVGSQSRLLVSLPKGKTSPHLTSGTQSPY